jgi:hypothetical protein
MRVCKDWTKKLLGFFSITNACGLSVFDQNIAIFKGEMQKSEVRSCVIMWSFWHLLWGKHLNSILVATYKTTAINFWTKHKMYRSTLLGHTWEHALVHPFMALSYTDDFTSAPRLQIVTNKLSLSWSIPFLSMHLTSPKLFPKPKTRACPYVRLLLPICT